jgi:hypothetical protein
MDFKGLLSETLTSRVYSLTGLVGLLQRHLLLLDVL